MPTNPVFDHDLPDEGGRDDKPDDTTSKLPGTPKLPSTPGPSTQGEQQGVPGAGLSEQRQKLLEDKVNDLYERFEERLGKPIAIPYDEFRLEGKRLFFNDIDLTALITKDKGGLRATGEMIMRALGFPEYVTTPNRGKAAAQALGQKVDDIVRKDMADDIISMESIEEFVDATESFMEETSFGGTDEITERERRGLNLELQTIRGNLKSLASKIISFDSEIGKAKGDIKKLEKQKARATEWQKAKLERDIENLNDKIEELNDKKKATQNARSLLSSEIYSQLRTIKETLMKIAGDDTSLLEKLKILFREQGITIASIVSAIGLLISTIVLAATGGGAAAGAAGGSAAGKGFVEKQLERLGKFLKYLAGKAGVALPGIMGTIVSFFVRVAATVVEYADKHLYMAIAAAAGFAVYYVRGV